MIIKNDEAFLRSKCEDVENISEAKEIIFVLENELNHSNSLGISGIGLAAIQVGIKKNVAIVRMDDVNFNLVNCKFHQGYDSTIFRQEGCLSFPGRIEDTKRFQEVHITDNLMYPYNFIATGLTAVVVQHELDHLNGILFTDNVVPTIVKKKVGPNEPCICGKKDSNTGMVKKFKKCCGK